jgi:DNA-binding MarR family transcriptional regulator
MATIANTNKKPEARVKTSPRASLAQLSGHAPEGLITYRVSVLAQQLSRLVDASVREALDLTSRQWRVLVILNRIGTTTSGEVARMAHFDHSQVSRVAFELAEKGLITQGSDAADRRKQMLALTPEGIDCLRNGVPASLEREKRLRSRLTASEYTSFCRALEMLGDEAQKMHGET